MVGTKLSGTAAAAHFNCVTSLLLVQVTSGLLRFNYLRFNWFDCLRLDTSFHPCECRLNCVLPLILVHVLRNLLCRSAHRLHDNAVVVLFMGETTSCPWTRFILAVTPTDYRIAPVAEWHRLNQQLLWCKMFRDRVYPGITREHEHSTMIKFEFFKPTKSNTIVVLRQQNLIT